MALKAKFARNYRSKKGNNVFKFIVTGSVEEIKAYKTAQGLNYREEELTKEPLFFTPIFQGKLLTLLITPNNQVVVDNTEIAAVESIIKNATGIYQQELAKLAAAHTLASVFGNSRLSHPMEFTMVPTEVCEPFSTEDNLSDLSGQFVSGADLV